MQYKLKKSFKFGQETIAEVEIKEDFDAGDVARVQNASKRGDGDAFIEILSIGTGFPAPKASKIPAADAVEISRLVTNFLNLGEN